MMMISVYARALCAQKVKSVDVFEDVFFWAFCSVSGILGDTKNKISLVSLMQIKSSTEISMASTADCWLVILTHTHTHIKYLHEEAKVP